MKRPLEWTCADEIADRLVAVLDLRFQLRRGRQLRRAQPVVADHAIFVGIGDRAGFEVLHACEGFLRERLHSAQEVVAKTHAADVERDAERLVAEEIFLITVPK